MKSLLLDQDAWDIVLDASGNLAVATEPYAIAQDVANACRLFAGELWFDTTKGIPYFEQILGHMPPASVITQLIADAARKVPGVVSAQCVIQSLQSRKITGQVQFTDASGTVSVVDI